ncbi:PML nuclear body scaffold [Phyllostomus discolor]|uniref:Protein PML n=1 Tax=Phyllostomus discolor TaxID=89673 RepID=A0A6J2L747_9CHIR|nr:protein PML isoform X3 [Phyllostomus discolor]KAF6132154.1 PML nuclear body scaffold [Phyllostomus discolor]
MQQEPVPSRSLVSQQDSALPHAPTMPPPESSDSHQPSPDQSPREQAVEEEEFQFLRCHSCQEEAKSPKLLHCLHTLCSGCLEGPGMQCPICRADQSLRTSGPALDNIFFESLQRRLSVYRQIVDAQARCTRCNETADSWCFECEQLLCARCFEAHQWFLKHEARPLAELRSQSVCEFLDGTRKSNNIFCSNPNHRSPMLTSIYCQGCAKPLCCTCALLDNSHGHLKCDITEEIQQRQEELGSMTQLLERQDLAFDSALAQMRSAISQLGRVRTDTEEVIRAGVRQLVAHVQAQETELLEAVNTRYQREYEKIAGQLGRLDAVLQRIRTGSVLVQRMKRYASDQEVLDMHDFLRKALNALHREEPQSLEATVRTDSFDEFKVRLQDLVSCITQRTDAAVPRRGSPEATSTPREPLNINLPEGPQVAQLQALGMVDTQPMAVVQSVPGAHPVPVCAYSIKDPSCGQEVSTTATQWKRKSCQTECPRKLIKMESEEEKEARLAQSSPEQPRPSTSKAVSPPAQEGGPESHTTGDEGLLLNSNHQTGDSEEAEERIVVISSDDSDVENSCMEPTETTAPYSLPAQPLLRAPGASHTRRAFHLSRSIRCRLTWTPYNPTKQAAVLHAKSPSPPAGHQEHAAIHRGISYPSRRTQRATRLHHIFRLPRKVYCAPTWTCPSPMVQAATLAVKEPPNHLANPQECLACFQRAISQPRPARRAGRSLGHFLRGSLHVAQWLNKFAFPLSSVAPQLDTSLRRGRAEDQSPQTLRAGVSPEDSDRTPVESPQIQVTLEAPQNVSPHLPTPEGPSTSLGLPQTSL